MNRKIIKTAELTLDDIPDDDAGWREISIFALTFDPMLELATTDIYKIQFTKFDEGSSLQELRRSLFLLQRAWNNRTEKIDENGLQTFRSLLALMKKKLTNQAQLD
jgi:hypothetical protein